MRQLTLVGKGRLAWRDVAPPALDGGRDALVRPLAVARCDADWLLLRDGGRSMRVGALLHLLDEEVPALFGRRPFLPPYPVGHECVAEVVECGEHVRSIGPGDRVIVPFQISCGRCAPCEHGLTGHCATVPPFSTYGFGASGGGWGGMMTDLVRVPYADAMLVPLPPGVDPVSVASAGDNLPDAWQRVAPHLQQRPGAPVLVIGAGARSVALYAVAIAIALGASEVDYVDKAAPRLACAESLGARAFEMGRAFPDRRYPIVVEASLRTDDLARAVRAVAPGGVCASVGLYPKRRVCVPVFGMYARGVTLVTGLANARAHVPAVLDLVTSGRLHPERVTTRIARWDEAPEAFVDQGAKIVVVRDAR